MHASTVLGGLFALVTLSNVLPAQTTIHISAYVDGRSRLILAGDSAQWQHFDEAAPGRVACDTGMPEQATLVNGNPWLPNWSDAPTCENRDCGGCASDLLTGVTPALPSSDFAVLVNPIHARGQVSIVEFPGAANGYRVVVEFDDRAWSGAEWYDVDVLELGCGGISRYCASTPNSTGLVATMGLSGSLSVSANDLHLLAFQCPPSHFGLFIYGATQTQIPFAGGYLCISPFSPGLYRAGHSFQIDASGAADLPMDIPSLPLGAPITTGSTWNFQFWYRDHSASGWGSNLSDALSATFCP
jgi:hypothetical protein